MTPTVGTDRSPVGQLRVSGWQSRPTRHPTRRICGHAGAEPGAHDARRGREVDVRTRIVGLAVWISVLTVALFGVPLAVGVWRYGLTREGTDLERHANAVAVAVAADVLRKDSIDDSDWTGSTRIAVYDDDLDRIAGDGPSRGGSPVAEALRGKHAVDKSGDDLVVVVPITHDADVIGAVRASGPQTEVVQKVAVAWGAMAALAVFVITAAWLVARRQARRLAVPLEHLTSAAGRLGDGDFSVRTRPEGISEIDAVGASLNTTAARLDDLLARERAFSADASHQLRTPLAGLRLRLEAALGSPHSELRSAIGESLVDADRLQATIEELLTLARERNERVEPLDLVALLAELSPEWAGRLALHGRDLDLRVAPEASTWPSASAAAVRQVLAVF